MGNLYRLTLQHRGFRVCRDDTRPCGPHMGNGPQAPAWTPADPDAYNAKMAEWKVAHDAFRVAECTHWEAPGDTKRALYRMLDDWDDYRQRCASAVRLPLIVLAGLR